MRIVDTIRNGAVGVALATMPLTAEAAGGEPSREMCEDALLPTDALIDDGSLRYEANLLVAQIAGRIICYSELQDTGIEVDVVLGGHEVSLLIRGTNWPTEQPNTDYYDASVVFKFDEVLTFAEATFEDVSSVHVAWDRSNPNSATSEGAHVHSSVSAFLLDRSGLDDVRIIADYSEGEFGQSTEPLPNGKLVTLEEAWLQDRAEQANRILRGFSEVDYK